MEEAAGWRHRLHEIIFEADTKAGKAFDVALLPAINEYASPLKLHEYMAAHLPTVGPDQPNLREVLVDGENATLTPPGDGDAFAAAVVALARDPERRRRLGSRARDEKKKRTPARDASCPGPRS